MNPPFEHFNYDELQNNPCNCALCVSIPEKRKAWQDNRYTRLWHKANCECANCLESDQSRNAYRAALKKHEIYCEMSYLARGHRLAPRFLTWLFERMQDPGYHPESWWATSSLNRTCAEWIMEWQYEVLPRAVWAVSGILCRDWDWDNVA